MSKRQFITYTVTSQTMGEATDEDADKYAAALQSKLEALYPEHDISVSVNNSTSSSQPSMATPLAMLKICSSGIRSAPHCRR